MKRIVWGLLALGGCLVATRANAAEMTLKLTSIGVEAEIDSDSTWTRAPYGSTATEDQLVRVRPASPKLTVTFHRGIFACTDPMGPLEKASKEGGRRTSTGYVAGGWHKQVVEQQMANGTTATVCGDVKKGAFYSLVAVIQGPSLLAEEADSLADLLSAVGEAAGVRGAAPPPTPPPPRNDPPPAPPKPPTPPPSKPPSWTENNDEVPASKSIKLSTIGATIDMKSPYTWKTEVRSTKTGPMDVVNRTGNNKPWVGVILAVRKEDRSCANAYKAIRAGGFKGTELEKPSFVPGNYYERALDLEGQQNRELITCKSTKAGALVVSIQHAPDAGDLDLASIAPIMTGAANALGSYTPPSTPGSTIGDDREEPSRPRPVRPEPDRPTVAEAKDPKLGPFELGGWMISPKIEGSDSTSFGGSLGYDTVKISGESTFGFAYGAGGFAGFTSKSQALFDAHGAAGFGMRLGAVTLIPLASMGIDGVGGGDSDFKMTGVMYWGLGGRLAMALGDSMGLDLFGEYLNRTPSALTLHSGNADVPNEMRLGGRLRLFRMKLRPSVGFKYTDYKESSASPGARGMTALLAFTF